MVPLSIRLILETNKKQNALKALARLKRLFDFELQGLAPDASTKACDGQLTQRTHR